MNNQNLPLTQWNRITTLQLQDFVDNCNEIIASEVINNFSSASIYWKHFHAQSTQLDKERMAIWKYKMNGAFETPAEEANAISDFIFALIEENIDPTVTQHWVEENNIIHQVVSEAHEYKRLKSLEKVFKEPKPEYIPPKPIMNNKAEDLKKMVHQAEKKRK